MRAKIEAARERQQNRCSGIPHNAGIPAGQVRNYANFEPPAFDAYKKMIDTQSLSTRSMDRLAKVARTVADLDGSDTIAEKHLAKAGGFVIGGILREAN